MRIRGLAIAGPFPDRTILSDPNQGCNLEGSVACGRAVVAIEPNEWAPVHLRHRGALHLRYRRRISGTHQFDIKIDKRVAFALRPCGYVWIVDDATRRAAAVHL